MEKRKKIAFGVVAAVLILLAVFYLIKAQPQAADNGTPNIAVDQSLIGTIDMQQAMQAHPEYQKLARLKKERNALAINAGKEGQATLEMAEPALDIRAANDAFRQKKMQKMLQKTKALNEGLEQKNAAFQQQFAAAHQTQLQAIDDAYLPQIFNLQLKIDTLQVSKEAGMEIQRQINDLKMEHAKKTQESQRVFFQKISDLMKVEQTKAKQELDAYGLTVDQELRAEEGQKADEAKTRNHLAMAGKTEALKLEMQNAVAGRGRLEDKDKEIAALQEQILQDISGKAAKIALQNQLSAVLTNVQVNVKALDITQLVIAEFKK